MELSCGPTATTTRHSNNDTTGASYVPPEAALRADHAPPRDAADWQLERLVRRRKLKVGTGPLKRWRAPVWPIAQPSSCERAIRLY
jgi:hypothetical protein